MHYSIVSAFFLTIMLLVNSIFLFFFFNDTATTEIYTLSLHDALPISSGPPRGGQAVRAGNKPSKATRPSRLALTSIESRSEEHTSELQSRQYLVCRLLLEKKKKEIIAPQSCLHGRQAVLTRG